jgi:cobalamin-dependent methionine synthase I
MHGLPKLHLLAIHHEAKVKEYHHNRILLDESTALTGALVVRFLAGAERVSVAVCTIGTELEEMSSSYMKDNPLLALALDGLGNAAVEALGQQVCRRIGQRAEEDGLETSGSLSPGEPDWPVDIGQPQIFSLLDTSRAGVRLTEGGMMIPKKTISFAVGIGAHMEQTSPCDSCSMNKKCRYRNA